MPLGGAALFARLEDAIEKEAVFWQGQLDVVWFAVENGIINPTTFRAHGKTLLHAATSWDNVDLLRYLVVERGTDPNLPDDLGIGALFYALDDMREEVAHFFINEAPGCKIDARVPLCSPSSGMTPLMVAAKRGMLPAVQVLIAKGADVCATSDTGGTALGWATYVKMEDCALKLLAAGASWRGSVEGWGLLKLAAANNLPRLVRALVRRMQADGEKEAAVTERMAEAARAATVEGRVASLRALVDGGLDVAAARCDAEGVCGDIVRSGLLNLAIVTGQQKAAAFLIEQGCDPRAPGDDRGDWPHHIAVAHGHLPILQWLVSTFHIYVDTPYGDGTTPLQLAAADGRLDMVQWLVGAGADVFRTIAGTDGVERRPSEIAAFLGHDAVAQYLLQQEEAQVFRTYRCIVA